MSAEATVADLLAFGALPEETQALARRVILYGPKDTLDKMRDEIAEEIEETERERDREREEKDLAEELLEELEAELLPAARFAALAIADRVSGNYWNDGDLEEKLAEAGILEAAEVDGEKTGCGRPDDCLCTEGDLCYRATPAGRLLLARIDRLEAKAVRWLEQEQNARKWKEYHARSRLLGNAVKRLAEKCGRSLAEVALEAARAADPTAEEHSYLHRAAVVALLLKAEPALAGGEIVVEPLPSGGLSIATPMPRRLELVK